MRAVAIGKVDLHLHSYASNTTDYYAANAFAIPESYSDPFDLYDLLKARGMSLVTITDHNSIDGVRKLLDAGRRDVFISAEMTTTFPEDGCNVHVTIANVTEAQFVEAHRLRRNIYEMIGYLDAEVAAEAGRPGGNKVAYFMTHPLMSTQNRPHGREGSLRVRHLEKAILLCNAFEVRNGSRTRALNELTSALLGSLDAAGIERLACKHAIAPKGERPWIKAVVGGSDDHAGINPGRTWTRFDHGASPPTANAVVEAIREGRTCPDGAHGGPVTLTHSVLKLLYDGSSSRGRRRGGGGKSVAVGGAVHAMLRLAFDAPAEPSLSMAAHALKAMFRRFAGARRPGQSFERILEGEVYALLGDGRFREALATQPSTDDRIFLVVSTLVNRMLVRHIESLHGAGLADLVGAIKEGVALLASHLFVSLPYFLSFMTQSADCRVAHDARKAFRLGDRRRLVLVTDTLVEINGVSLTIKRMMREAERRGLDVTVVTVLADEELERHARASPELRGFLDSGRLKVFASVRNFGFPEYDGLELRLPPVLEMLKYLQEQGFTKMQISTPGLVGLAGMLAAKTLGIETAATYHTSIPEYVENYTRDISLEALAWKYMLLFYHAVDEVVVPSHFIRRLLHKRGLRKRKLLVLDRWIDIHRFHPDRRSPGYWKRYGIEDEDRLVKFVYVGRVGVEKDVHLAAQAYRRIRETRQDAHLIVIGDGPYRGELQRLLEGLPATFTGFLEGDELARALASADVKVFPSCTDTWGNAPLEAQASGLPVVVSDVGGPADLMVDGVTGLRFRARDTGDLYRAMVALMDAPTRLGMGRAARRFAEDNRVDEPFTAILDADAYRRRLEDPAAARPPKGRRTARPTLPEGHAVAVGRAGRQTVGA